MMVNAIMRNIPWKKIWVQIRDCYLYYCRHALIINGYVDDLTWRGIRHRNWGDDLNYYFIRLLTGRPIIFYHNFWLAKRFCFKNYLCIGTLLDAVNYSNRKTVVWGSGVSGQERDFVLPEKILSVRGACTAKFLADRNIPCPALFGDPALLLPLYYQSGIKKKKYKLGIIPHVIDQLHPVVCEMRQSHPEVLMINLAHYKKWTDVIDQICSCEMIASSSLHGLIVSDAYGVPNCWIELSGKISGGYFKFYDYASSVGRKLEMPLVLTAGDDLKPIYLLCSEWVSPKIGMEAIVNSCPFNLQASN
jgi:pyruvyltransferase